MKLGIPRLRSDAHSAEPRSAASNKMFSLAKVALAAIMLVASGVLATAATPSKPASALSGLSCTSNTLVATTTDGVFLVNQDTAAMTPLLSQTSTPTHLPTGMNLLNQVGLSANASKMIFLGLWNNQYWLVDYDVAADQFSLTQTNGGVAGAFNLSNGVFYYGSVGGGHAIINAYDPATKLVTPNVLDVSLPGGASGGNGDIAFDASGNLWIVSSSNSPLDYYVYRVNAPIPTSGTNTAIGILTAQQLGGGGFINGIAFGTDGYIYTSGAGLLRKFHPATANLESTLPLPGVSDLGSCADPPRVRAYKNLPAGRFAPTDQFTMTITPAGAGTGNVATTTGTAVGLQKEVAGPVLGVAKQVFTVTETAAGTTNLANYVTTWECMNESLTPPAVVSKGSGVTATVTMPDLLAANVNCTFTNLPIGIVRVQKDLPSGRALPGDQFTLSLSPGGAPSATTTGTSSGVQAATVTLNTAMPGTSYTVTEAVAGTTNLSYYGSKWACVDTANGNLAVASGTGVTGTFTMPVTGGPNRADILCTFTNTPGANNLAVAKSVDPVDGSTVVPGQTVTYTLSFTNTGQSPAAVNYTDDMTGVLDDAELVTPPTAAPDSGLTASALAGGKTTITGFVKPGATALVTAKVKVKPDDQRGDNVLLNFLFTTGTTPPTTCAPADPLCTSNPVPELVPSKSVSPPDGSTVMSGEVVSYTLNFDNTLGKAAATVNWEDDIKGVLDDATVVAVPTTTTSTLAVTAIANGRFAVTGTVPAGVAATVTYKVQVKADPDRGDNQLLNFLLPPGTPPPTTCAVGDPMCTVHPVPELVVSKSVDPADGSTVIADQVLTYTLTFNNTLGKAAAPVSWDDNLVGVLDDADVVSAPVSSISSMTVSPIQSGVFQVRGSLAAGQTATVIYKVKVKPDGKRGDNQLLNFVFPPGTLVPPECVDGDPLCTRNPVPDLMVRKDVSPVDGSTVVAGQTLVYTMSFDNTKGKAPATVKWSDDLSGVLDDAVVTADPKSSNASLVVSPIASGRFSIDGTVAAGTKVEVTMSVRVKPDGSRGDNVLLNFLLLPGTTTPGQCPDGDPLCTRNPVSEIPGISLRKDVLSILDTGNDGPSTPGDIVTFSFLVTNTGNVVLNDIILMDPKLSPTPLTCPSKTLKPGEKMNCTGPTYTLTTADLAVGSMTNVATVTGQPPTGPRVEDTDDVKVPVIPPVVTPDTGGHLPGPVLLIASPMILAGIALLALRRRPRVLVRRT